MSKTKQFNIGERAYGGIIEATIDKSEQEVRVRCLDYETLEPLFGYDESTDDLDYLERILSDWTDLYFVEQIIIWLGRNGFEEAANDYRYS